MPFLVQLTDDATGDQAKIIQNKPNLDITGVFQRAPSTILLLETQTERYRSQRLLAYTLLPVPG